MQWPSATTSSTRATPASRPSSTTSGPAPDLPHPGALGKPGPARRLTARRRQRAALGGARPRRRAGSASSASPPPPRPRTPRAPTPAPGCSTKSTPPKREIDRLRAQGIDKIVLLSHLGYTQDQAIAAQLSGVDVIVGGDSHSLLGDESLKTFGLSPAGAYPTATRNKDGDTVCVVQAWQYSAVVGELEVLFDGDGKVKSCAGQPHILIGSSLGTLAGDALAAARADLASQPALRVTEPDAAASAVLAEYAEQVKDFGASRSPSRSRTSACAASPAPSATPRAPGSTAATSIRT